MSPSVEALLQQYPDAQAWAFGDTPELMDTLANLVVRGIKTATSGSLAADLQQAPLRVGSYHIVLNSADLPVCVIRIHSQGLIRFCDMSEALAALEGEGDRTLRHWQAAHRDFFRREGTYSEEMELVYTTFRLVSVVRANAQS
ncbi:ASCH domain-containing protein [Pantoea sp. 1.19]|uniref:ASCH domain-containing protein n=1 Tax=Pantoea sp. 1.19 TaxID=1925589 RepID=UPI000948BD83|nr:ASCH domain-containing protein [Pantoea sp. 1.19]